MPVITQGKNNWKLIAIIVALAIFAGTEILTYISNFNSDLTFLSFFLEGKKPDQNIRINNEEIKKIFIVKYPQYSDTLSVRIEKETENYARGSVNFVTGKPGGIFLAVKSDNKWQVVHDGNGQIPCSLSIYGFPPDMLSDCATTVPSN
jgi:hypothetical protein